MVKLLYLGKLADMAGTISETLDLPSSVTDTHTLRNWLSERFAGNEASIDASVRIALDGEICIEPASLGSATEIALLPPVGGG